MSFWDPTTWEWDPTKWSASSIDPTTAEGRSNLLWAVPGLKLADLSLGDNLGNAAKKEKEEYNARRARDEAAGRAQSEADYFAQLGRDYREVTPESEPVQRRAADLYAPAGAEIDLGQTRSTAAIARGAARRGTTSGYAQGMQTEVWQAAAKERANQRRLAIEQAVGLGQKEIAGEASIRGYGTPIVQQMYAQAEARHRQALEDAAKSRSEYLRLIGMGLGYVVGGPVGGAVGGQLAGTVAGGGGSAPGYNPTSQMPWGYTYQPQLPPGR